MCIAPIIDRRAGQGRTTDGSGSICAMTGPTQQCRPEQRRRLSHFRLWGIVAADDGHPSHVART